jgi:tetratricopeptide (TPR) repeat protein
MDETPPTSANASGAWRRSAPGLLAAALAVLVYAGTLGHAQAYDDFFILRSPLLAHPWNLKEFFAGGFYARPDRTLGLYRPLGQWSLVLNANLAKALTGKYDAWAVYHVVSVLLHAAASFLVFQCLSRVLQTRWVAGAAAILWALHPIHAEVAANITARYESLALIFGIGFLLAHRSGRRILAALLLFGALGCKESAIALVPMAMGVDALFPNGGPRFDARRWIGPVVVVAIWMVLRWSAISDEETSAPYVTNPVAAAAFGVRALTAAKVQLLYLRDQLLPLWLSADHSFRQLAPIRTLADPFVLGFLAVAAVVATVAWLQRKRRPEIALCVLVYAVLFALASNFLLPIGTIMADRLAYAPSIFVCLALALLLARVRPRGAGVAGVAVLALFFGWQARARAAVWKDELTLFRDEVRTAPESAKAHANLGDALRQHGELAEAVAEYQRALEIYPYWPEPYVGLGQAYEQLEVDPEILINTWADSIRYGTRGERPLLGEALAAVDVGDWPGLIDVRNRIAAADPEDRFLVRVERILHGAQLLADVNRDGEDWIQGNLHFRLGDWQIAETRYRRALHHRDLPGNEIPATVLNMATCCERLGRAPRADHLRRLAAAWASRSR